MTATLYSLAISPPGIAVRIALELKGIPHRVVDLPPGLHPAVVRLRGFRENTVPALRIDGRRLQRSPAIMRALDGLVSEPPLFPADPDARRAVEEAEAWGETELQMLVRRIYRWAAVNRTAVRRAMAEIARMPAPGLVAATGKPLAIVLARAVDAGDHRIGPDLSAIPGAIDRVDRLVAEGVIGADPPNAADLQIATSVRALLAVPELARLVQGRPAAELALRWVPDFPAVGAFALPRALVPALV